MIKLKVGTGKRWLLTGAMTFALIIISGCVIDTSHVGQYVKPYESWKEEMALQDGRMLIVDRTLSYGRSAGIGQGRLIDKRTLDFVIPGTRQTVHWEGDEHVIPMLLDFKDGVPYLAARPFSCFSFELLGRPIPPYMLFKYTGQWERIAMADFPLEFVHVNLSTGDKDYIERLAGEKVPNETGYVPARIVMKANASKDISYRSIVRRGKGNFGGCLVELEQLDKNRRK
ncbi:MAG: hypothetical protein U0997_09885 [Sulfurimicrobium sp.]|nr:hypothetical protein [Sulfurimicrobium sp.]